VIVLHQEPHHFGRIYDQHPGLKSKYVIGSCVWEADKLPDPYKKAMPYIQEVWTPSRYCLDIFEQYHHLVHYIPYVIARDMSCSEEDQALVKRALNYSEEHIYFLCVTRIIDRRKNAEGLVNAFLKSCTQMKHSRLILKARSCDPPNFIHHPQIIYLPTDLTEGHLNALYKISHIYVSAHHSEAWGLTLSDAMLFQKPIIATGYSGNLEFMNDANSVLVEYREQNTRSKDWQGFFVRGMRWAYPVQRDLQDKMLLLYRNLDQTWVKEIIKRASKDAVRFDRSAVKSLLQDRIDQLQVALT